MRFFNAAKSSVVLELSAALLSNLSRFFAMGDVGGCDICCEAIGVITLATGFVVATDEVVELFG